MPFGFKTTAEKIAELSAEVVEVRAELKAVVGEWEDFYDKMTRKAARDRKRARDDDDKDPGEPPGRVLVENDANGLPRGVLLRRQQRALTTPKHGE